MITDAIANIELVRAAQSISANIMSNLTGMLPITLKL